MQEKRNKGLLITLLVLLTVTAVVVFLQTGGEKKFEQKDLFKVGELKAIDRVELISRRDTVQLTFNGIRWKVNSLDADRDMIDVLFATLLQAEAKRPVSENRNDSIASAVHASGVQVRLFETENLRKAFTTGGNTRKTEAYFIDETSQAYVMQIPGYRVYVSGVFELTENDWRDKSVFAFNWNNFKNLAVTFTNKPSDNFEVKLSDGFFSVDKLDTDTTKLNDFLDAVSFLTVDEYVEADSLRTQPSLASIILTDIADRQYGLAILPIVNNGKTACLINETQPAWIDNRKLGRLVKKRDFFAKKP